MSGNVYTGCIPLESLSAVARRQKKNSEVLKKNAIFDPLLRSKIKGVL